MPTSPGTRERPNANYILAIMRDDDLSDPWGTGMAWAFAVCENLAVIGGEIPQGLGYSPSIAGPILESHEDADVRAYLLEVPEPGTPTAEERVAEVEHAAVCLERYLNWVEAAGRSY